jgi:hypothetical protein
LRPARAPIAIAVIVLLASALAGCAGAGQAGERSDPPTRQGGTASRCFDAPSDPCHFICRFRRDSALEAQGRSENARTRGFRRFLPRNRASRTRVMIL